MYTTQFFPLLLRHLKICWKLYSTPYEFSKKYGKLVITKDPTRIRMFRLQIVLLLGSCIVMLVLICFGRLTTAKKFQGFLFFSMYVMLLSGRWNYKLDVAMEQTINSAMEFEKKLVEVL
ncbi:hypothetical protein Fcan01_22008 [Folsomia candida]|uniref:Uncharacterized protein n=1 Tax=Folsomia candida TaxID=158441 RepID=A0A226DD41_FOLCA|nr:hypothetical protein Fcan01_22008 [Folsomia candida]